MASPGRFAVAALCIRIVSSLALMRWLEATPLRYDAGMRVLTLGRISRLHAAIVEAAAPVPGARILEIGCGTGAVTEGLVAGGAFVTALDQNPEMLEQARVRLAGASGKLDLLERTAAEIDGLTSQGFDAVVASLCLSEMSAGERAFVLGEARSRLRPGGVLVAGDEVRPRARWQRWLHAALRVPQAVLAWLVAGSTSRPIPDLRRELRAAGLDVRDERRWLLGSLAVLVAERAVDAGGDRSLEQ
jgi:demethylmenaquinone methyltransferase/2-methoxy-6-polyprenyl-1,4-benzoquinol methylase